MACFIYILDDSSWESLIDEFAYICGMDKSPKVVYI